MASPPDPRVGDAPLRILHVAHGWPPAQEGGTERYAAALAAAQAALGHRTARFTPAEVLGTSPPRGFAGSWDWPGAESAFGAAMGRLRPDVVHVHHLTGLSVGILRRAREGGAAVVLTLHDAWLRCARGQLVDREGRRCEGPEPFRCARCLAPALYGPLPGVARLPPLVGPVRRRDRAVAEGLAAVDLVLSPSAHLPGRLGLPAVHLPLPLLRPVAPAPPRPPGPVHLLFVGALIPTKGADLAVEAFARLPAGAATLTLAGPALPYDGTDAWARALTRRVAALPGARWLGAVAPAALDAVYADADVLLFPSRWEENSPFVLREAAAAGLRILAADIPGAREVAPNARFVADEGGWAGAVAAEIREGQRRVAPVAYPGLADHAAQVLAHYRAFRARGASAPSPR